MQLMSDALMVLGSRLGWMIAPTQRRAYLPRYGPFPGTPFEVRAGLRYQLAGKTVERVLPLCPAGQENPPFAFCEQELTPTSIRLSGVDPDSRLKLTLTLRIPFWPGDADFSTMPVLLISAELKRLPIMWRWIPGAQASDVYPVEVFISFGGQELTISAPDEQADAVDIRFTPPTPPGGLEQMNPQAAPQRAPGVQHERVIVLAGQRQGTGFTASCAGLEAGQEQTVLRLAWCTFDEAALEVLGELSPFRYHRHADSLQAVTEWARANADRIEQSGERFDALTLDHSLGQTTNRLLAYTFHSWLINTWWVDTPHHGEWYSCWEGSCYFHSTVDVEYNQLPLYLSFWPDLLRMLLDQWPHFLKDGRQILGERGAGTQYVSHDMGIFTQCNVPIYPHDMPVEENANYLLLSLVYWRRTGDDSPLRAHCNEIKRLMDFLVATDTNNNGVPDEGVANTIDDACGAVQFAREQVYLGVKTHAALLAGIEILAHLSEPVSSYLSQADRLLTTLNAEGWDGDHFLVCLGSSVHGAVNPWTGQPATEADMVGWNAPHIYTTNGLLPLWMLGRDHPLPTERIDLDLVKARAATLTRFGCRHLQRDDNAVWIAMNLWRDQAAAYRGFDFLADVERYWDWQTTTNSLEPVMFFETVYGNNLCYYPRGAASWGIFEAAAGLRYDVITQQKAFKPIRTDLRVPLFSLADWSALRELGEPPHLTAVGGAVRLS